MIVTLAEVALRNGDLAMRTVAELDSCISTSVVGTYELLTMLDCFRNDEVGSLFVREDALRMVGMKCWESRNRRLGLDRKVCAE